MDGDGLDDLIFSRRINANNQQIGAFRNTGNGWVKMSSKFEPPRYISEDGRPDLGTRFVDVDGDGRDDMVFHRYISENRYQVGEWKSTENGWIQF